jgi:hypothetical protein
LLRRSAARFQQGDPAIQPDTSPTQISHRRQPTQLIALTIAARSPNCRTGLANRAHQVDAREPDDPCRRMPAWRPGLGARPRLRWLAGLPFSDCHTPRGGYPGLSCLVGLAPVGWHGTSRMPLCSTSARRWTTWVDARRLGLVGLLSEGGDCQMRPRSLPGEGQPIVETDRGLPFEEGVGLEVTLLKQGLTSKSASPTRGPYPASLVSSPLAYSAKPAPGAASHGLCGASLHQ